MWEETTKAYASVTTLHKRRPKFYRKTFEILRLPNVKLKQSLRFLTSHLVEVEVLFGITSS